MVSNTNGTSGDCGQVALRLRLAQSMNETIVRVCAACQSETKTVLPTVPNVAYSHGACRRHALKSFAEIVGIEAAEKIIAAKPESYFCPELGAIPTIPL